MFLIHMPWTFRVGDRADVRINLKPAVLWWRDADTLVINDTDVRRICDRRPVDDPNSDSLLSVQLFTCTDADGSAYTVTNETDDGFIVQPKP